MVKYKPSIKLQRKKKTYEKKTAIAAYATKMQQKIQFKYFCC